MPETKLNYLVILPNCWGKAESIAQAEKNARRAGGLHYRKKVTTLIFRFDPAKTEWKGIGFWGQTQWGGATADHGSHGEEPGGVGRTARGAVRRPQRGDRQAGPQDHRGHGRQVRPLPALDLIGATDDHLVLLWGSSLTRIEGGGIVIQSLG